MASDLGAKAAEVHVKAREVLGFWFDLLMPEQWFAESHWLDAEIGELFGTLRDEVLSSGAADWREGPQTLLAAVILLDQFSRNIHRGTPQAFAQDPMALALAQEAVAQGVLAHLSPVERSFLLLPYMHSESRIVHEEAERLFAALGIQDNLDFERRHKAIVDRFGRYPHRNAILGRTSSAEELAFLETPGSSF